MAVTVSGHGFYFFQLAVRGIRLNEDRTQVASQKLGMKLSWGSLRTEDFMNTSLNGVEKKRSTYDYKPVCENEKPASENRESQLAETTMETPLKTQLSKIC